MSEYVYRVDTQTGLQKINDNYFRAKRWLANDSYCFPHELLKQLHSTLPATDSLYRICFYTSHARAENSLSSNFLHLGISYILRCPKTSVLSLGFRESWDDGFKEGDAYLFWIQESLLATNANFSSAGIHFDHFEIWKQGHWRPLQDHYREIALVANPIVSPARNSCSSVSALEKKSWWKFWCHANG